MDRALIGNFHQSRALCFGQVAGNGDVTGDLTDVAVGGFAICTVLGVDPAVRQAHREAFGCNPLALGIKPHRHRRAGTEGGKQIIVRPRSGIIAANRDRLIGCEHMASGPHALCKTPAAGFADLDNAIRQRVHGFPGRQIP